ncbi:hypothetical protein ACOMICROBIO_NCLOACGD_04871 [Vibrio sp. B1ASS3]|nr:hypothetical protein ACOMICROBIO_NCLOACGD_04871 [Vibrio sp. B1ASS3]CAE6958691.1 hypothetical protein ACOMICROBIO_NCLOACGD_04871 [Vibrio sp. B1ASS3]
MSSHRIKQQSQPLARRQLRLGFDGLSLYNEIRQLAANINSAKKHVSLALYLLW